MKLPLYWVDAFTQRVFSGNPAGVVPLAEWLPPAVLQRVAFENGLSETAFFVRTGGDRFHLRWFTPKTEVPLCGHATLATAHVLFSELGQRRGTVVFDTRSGPLEAVAREDGLVELNFPALPPVPVQDDRLVAALASGLGRVPAELYQAKGSSTLLAVFGGAEDVRSLAPDFAALVSTGCGRTIATAPGVDCDFVSRFFAPGVGIPEDPVTGSAHCTLVPYWAGRLEKSRLRARQISARGGELFCENADGRVRLGGRAVLYLRGEIEVDPSAEFS